MEKINHLNPPLIEDSTGSKDRTDIFFDDDDEFAQIIPSKIVRRSSIDRCELLSSDTLPNDLVKTQMKEHYSNGVTAPSSAHLQTAAYEEEIRQLKLRVQELEDWNETPSDSNSLQSLTERNRQLESDLQRLQTQQRNNQLALDRLDEYEETISQLQDELDQFRSTGKKPSVNVDQLREELNEEKENHRREIELREMLERQLMELHDSLQQLEQDKVELRQQIESVQTSTTTPGSPPSNISDRLAQLESEHEQQLETIYQQFVSVLPMDDDRSLPLIDRFAHLSSHLGTFSIIQEELDCLKQILVEKQDELTKLQSHFESSQQADRSNFVDESDDDDDDELTEILHFQSRTPSRQSVTPGEKQQLIAQNELLSSLLIDKEQELISFQQTEKTFDALRNDLQQSTIDREMKDKELNDIRNILDEKLRENSSLRKEKIYFIERITDFERERQTISTDQHSDANLVTRYNELNDRFHQLQIEYESLQSLIQQKNEAYLQCQNELNTYQNLFYHQKKKTDESDLLRSTLAERDRQIEEHLDRQRQMQLELKRSTHERDLAIVEKKQLESIQLKVEQSEEFLREQISIVSRLTQENNELLAEREKTRLTHSARLVDQQLVKNVLLSYFHTPMDKQLEVLPLLGALVGFTPDECQKAISVHQQTSNGWFTGWLGSNPSKPATPPPANPSFAELLIQYVDQQSTESDLATSSSLPVVEPTITPDGVMNI